MSPLSRIGGCTPSLNCSVIAISTCVYLRAGPSTRTRSMRPFGPTMRELFLAGILAGLREVGVLGELMARAEQRLDVLLREVDVMRRDLDEKRLLLLRLQHARDVGAARARATPRAPSCVPRRWARRAPSPSSRRWRCGTPRRSRARRGCAASSSVMPMHSSPCSASARTSALPWPMPPVKITASSPPIDGDVSADVFAHAIAIGLEREQRARLARRRRP